MAMFYAAIVILCLSGNTVAQITVPGQCPNITKGLTDLDVKQISNGSWYEVRKYPVIFEMSSVCNVVKFQQGANNSIDLVDDYFSTISGKNVPYFVSLNPCENDPSAYECQLPDTRDGVMSTCWFLAADYNGCMVAFCCTDRKSISLLYTWAVCRNPKPGRSELDKVYQAYDDNNIETDSLEVVEQKDCPPNPFETISK